MSLHITSTTPCCGWATRIIRAASSNVNRSWCAQFSLQTPARIRFENDARWVRAGLAACIIWRRRHCTPRVIEILHNMGILHRITTALSPEERLLRELADITGRHHELADRLARHAGLCAYPNIAAGLVALAAREDEHARALDAIPSRPPL